MANSEESLAELYFAKLKSTTNPGLVLAQFYGALLGKEIGRSEVINCNMLIKIFGKVSVFLAIIDITRIEQTDEFPYGYLFKICKNRLESYLQSEITLSSFDNLDRKITDIQKDISKVKKIDPEKASKILDDRKEEK